MRDYTYLEGARFLIHNIFRSQRFDIDRLDLNWVSGPKPEFSRGFRVVDHQEGKYYMLHDVDADNLIYSMAFISSNDSSSGYEAYDKYLITAIESKNYLVDHEVKKKEPEEVLH